MYLEYILIALLLLAIIIIIILVVKISIRKKTEETVVTPIFSISESEMINSEEYVRSFAILEPHKNGPIYENAHRSAMEEDLTVGLVMNKSKKTPSRYQRKEIHDNKTQMIGQSASEQINIPKLKLFLKYNLNGCEKYHDLNSLATVIGRDANQCDIVIESDRYMGSAHFIIIIKGNQIFVGDLNSKNGTFIGDEMLTGIVHIKSNTNIKAASTEFEILF